MEIHCDGCYKQKNPIHYNDSINQYHTWSEVLGACYGCKNACLYPLLSKHRVIHRACLSALFIPKLARLAKWSWYTVVYGTYLL